MVYFLYSYGLNLFFRISRLSGFAIALWAIAILVIDIDATGIEAMHMIPVKNQIHLLVSFKMLLPIQCYDKFHA